jgi:murein DD-endopeptidase MepM/ murein hydrolase activator NlpD
MKKFSVPMVTFGLVLFVLLGTLPMPISAQSTDLEAQIEAVQKQRDQLLQEQKALQAQLDALSQQSKSLTGNIKTLDATRNKLLADLKVTQNGIAATGLQIDKLSKNISANQSEIQRHELAISDALKELSTYDNHTVVYDLLTYRNIADVWTDETNLSSVQDKLQDEIASLKETTDLLAKNKADAEAQKKSLASLQSQLSGQKKVVESTQTAKKQLLNETKSQEATYQMLLAQNIAREKEFEAQLFQYESQLKAASTGSAPSAEHSILSWPLDKIRISQQFGKTSSSGRLYASGTHNGVDFSTPVGTAVHTVRSGVIKAQGNTDLQPGCYSYGRWILVEHDNGLSTIYGHLSATIVTVGQGVTTGQIIGYSGGQPGADGAGYSTGPHLHLGLFVTAGVSVQRYTSSIGCKNTSIPIANPTDYLDPLAYLPKL